MAGIIDKLGFNLKTKLKFNPESEEQAIGKKIIKDTLQNNIVADKQDFSNYTKSEYVKLLEDSINDGIKKFDGDFFLEVSFRKDNLLKKVFKLIPFLRSTCPLPFYGKDVFSYSSKDGKLELLWAIPSKELCVHPELLPLHIKGNDKLIETIQRFNSGFYFEAYEAINKRLGRI